MRHGEIFGVFRKTESSISVLAGKEPGLEISLNDLTGRETIFYDSSLKAL